MDSVMGNTIDRFKNNFRFMFKRKTRSARAGPVTGGSASSKSRNKPVKLTASLALVYLMAFMFGRTIFVGTIAPLGPSFYGAYRTSLGDLSSLAALAVLAGTASLRQPDQLLVAALSIAAVTVFIRPAGKTGYIRIADSVIAGFCLFMARLGSSIFSGQSLGTYLAAFIEGLCSIVAGLVFATAFCSTAFSSASTSGFRTENRQQSVRSGQAAIILGLFAISGLQGIMVYSLDIGTMAVMAATLVMAFAGGPGTGAFTGLLGGLVACLAGSQEPFIMGMLGLAGVLAGLGRKLGRPGAVLGFLSAGLAMSFYGESALIVSNRLLEQIISAVAIIIMNENVMQFVKKHTPTLDIFPKMDLSSNILPASEQTSKHNPAALTVVSSAVNELANLFTKASKITAQNRYERAQSPGQNGRAMSGGRRTKDTSRQALKPQGASGSLAAGSAHNSKEFYKDEEQLGPDIVATGHLVDKVCHDCPNRSFCWEEQFGDTYEGFIQLTGSARLSGRLGLSGNGSVLADRCLRFRELIAHLNHEKQVERLEKRLSTVSSETIDCLAFQYRSLGQLMSEHASDTTSGIRQPSSSATSLKPLKLSVSGITIPAQGTDRAGDMWFRHNLDNDKALLVLADGMGKGETAAKQSDEAISLLKALIGAGLNHTSCIAFLNSSLYLAWGPDNFIALDCLVVDASVERAYFYKLGAPPSFVRKQDGNVLAVRGSTPPAGAVTDTLCYGTSEPIAPGDMIFLVSDGVFRSSPVPARSEQMLMGRIGRLKVNDSDSSVRSLVNHCLRHQGQAPEDDITIVGALFNGV